MNSKRSLSELLFKYWTICTDRGLKMKQEKAKLVQKSSRKLAEGGNGTVNPLIIKIALLQKSLFLTIEDPLGIYQRE